MASHTEPIPELVNLEPVEKKFYDLVTGVVIEYAQRSMANGRFLLAQPQRQMTSSMAASLNLWQKKLVELGGNKESGWGAKKTMKEKGAAKPPLLQR